MIGRIFFVIQGSMSCSENGVISASSAYLSGYLCRSRDGCKSLQQTAVSLGVKCVMLTNSYLILLCRLTEKTHGRVFIHVQ